MLDLYSNIKKRRQQLNMSQQELAEAVGYKGKSMISQVEKGLVDLPESMIIKFADALFTTPATLMGWEDVRINPVTGYPEDWTRADVEDEPIPEIDRMHIAKVESGMFPSHKSVNFSIKKERLLPYSDEQVKEMTSIYDRLMKLPPEKRAALLTLLEPPETDS